jgi:hypothetical protein
MACKKISDKFGSLFRVPEFKPKDPSNKSLPARAGVDVWWDRDAVHKADEDIILRQENGKTADTIIINLGQAYDLLHALASLIMDK